MMTPAFQKSEMSADDAKNGEFTSAKPQHASAKWF
jgi:hypothetical protein